MSRGPQKSFDPNVALSRAMEVFRDRGYAGAGIRDLLDAMGISRKSLYDTFGSKEDLYVRALVAYADSLLTDLESALDRGSSPFAALRAVLAQKEQSALDPEASACLLGVGAAQTGPEEPRIQRALREHLQRVENAFTRAIGRARDRAEILADVDPHHLACALLAAIQGLGILGRTGLVQRRDRGVLTGMIDAVKSRG
ncbi:MAG: TetR/AcrR family transcriptional regulator [Planctomycetota bacterium]